MKFSINTKELVAALLMNRTTVEAKTHIPILGMVLLDASEGKLTLTTTDLEIGMIVSRAAEVETPGRVCIGAKRLYDYIRQLPECTVTIEVDGSNWAMFRWGKARAKFPGMDAENYPALPTAPQFRNLLPVEEVRQAISRTGFAISAEESRFTLNGALLELSPERMKMVATDGHRMAIRDSEETHAVNDIRTIVPKRALAVLTSLSALPGAGDTFEMAVDGSHLWFKRGDYELVTRKLEGNFPDYNRVLPKDGAFTGLAKVDRVAFLESVIRTMTMADERSKAVRLSFSDGAIAIAASSVEVGESVDEIPCEYNGDPIEVGYNASYLADFLRNSTADNVVLGASSKGPNRLSDGHSTCVIMPMRI